MVAYDLLSAGKSLASHRMLSTRQLLDEEPGLGSEGLKGGARYYDAQVTFAERLVIENILDAAANDVDVRNYAPVTAVERDGDAFTVHFREEGKNTVTASAPVVINAAGPWVDDVLGVTEGSFRRQMGGTKGSHIIVGSFPGAPRDAIYVEAESDGRPIFIVPWNDQYLVGTTDLRYEGDPGEARAEDDEIAYLLAEANRVIPGAGLTKTDIRYTYSGIRPLPFNDEGPVSAITRRHIIREHPGDTDGLISIIGGKLTTYRSLAEQATDVVCRRLGRSAAGRPTRSRSLPGGGASKSLPALLAEAAPDAADRLLGIYGSRVHALAALCEEEPALCRTLDASSSVLVAEVVFAIRYEFARTLVDLLYRRLMVGLSGERPDTLDAEALEIAAAELNWDTAEQERQRGLLDEFDLRLRRQR